MYNKFATLLLKMNTDTMSRNQYKLYEYTFLRFSVIRGYSIRNMVGPCSRHDSSCHPGKIRDSSNIDLLLRDLLYYSYNDLFSLRTSTFNLLSNPLIHLLFSIASDLYAPPKGRPDIVIWLTEWRHVFTF